MKEAPGPANMGGFFSRNCISFQLFLVADLCFFKCDSVLRPGPCEPSDLLGLKNTSDYMVISETIPLN